MTDFSYVFSSASNVTQRRNSSKQRMSMSMYGMFQSAFVFNQDISAWNTAKVTSMNSMFSSAINFNSPLNTWNVGAVTDFTNMFNSASNFNRPLNNWNTAAGTSMNATFYNAFSFDQDISSWNMRSVSNVGNMLVNVRLSTANYNALLIGWVAQLLKPNLSFNAGTSAYTSAATAARNYLISNFGWTIADGGLSN